MNQHSTHLDDGPDRAAEYQRHLTLAAEALVAAIRTEATDGGEIVSHLLATVAANLGGIHMLTDGRPGSWEADYVDQLLASTVGPDGEYLLQYRTASIEIVECVELAMVDLDIDYLYDESFTLIDAIESEAARSGDEAAAIDRLDHAGQLIDRLRTTEYAAYRDAFEERVREAARELVETRSLPADVPVSVRWVDWRDHDRTTGSREAWGTVELELWDSARRKTPPPGFAEPLDAILGSPGARLRASGLLPHQRIPDLASYLGEPAAPGVR